MPKPEEDAYVRQVREQISDLDRSIVDAVNRRLKLVTQLKRYKDDRGMAFVDPDREEWMFSYQSRANRGPLSDEGLRAFYAELLALTKREVS
jgi:chorismate mutase / prephenate dehydratase